MVDQLFEATIYGNIIELALTFILGPDELVHRAVRNFEKSRSQCKGTKIGVCAWG